MLHSIIVEQSYQTNKTQNETANELRSESFTRSYICTGISILS